MKYLNSKLTTLITFLLGIILGGLITTVDRINLISIEQTAYFITAAVSFTALIFGIYQARYTAEHNRLQLKPRLIVRTRDLTELEEYDLFTVDIVNNGLGPAEINDAYLEIQDVPRRFGLGNNGIDQYLYKIFGNNYDHIEDDQERLIAWLTDPGTPFFQENEGLAINELIASGKSRRVISVSLPKRSRKHYYSDNDKRAMRNKARDALNKTNIFIEFKSLYGEPDTYSSKPLIKKSN